MKIAVIGVEEVILVAKAQQIEIDFEERWNAIKALFKKLASNAKGSMLQDVKKGRRTEINVINGAIVEAGRRLGISISYNNAMIWLIRGLKGTFSK